MKRINIDILERGDIVLTTSSGKDSAFIRKITNSDISHAMICVARSSVIDATGEGVQARNIQKLLYEDDCSIYILKPKNPLSSSQLNSIINYARSATGTSYTKTEAAKAIAPSLSGKGGVKQFCSRMVARAYASADIKLVKNPDFCTPEDLKNSELLMQADDSWVEVTDEYIHAVELIGDATIGMREKTNKLLSTVRSMAPNVESLNDIDLLLIQRADLDDPIAKAFHSSGYLEHWKEEISRFPWRYDQELIVKFYYSLTDPAELLDYCRDTLRDHEIGTFAHWDTNAQGYNEIIRTYPRETFRLLGGLYTQLSSNHQQRVQSAKFLLSLFG